MWIILYVIIGVISAFVIRFLFLAAIGCIISSAARSRNTADRELLAFKSTLDAYEYCFEFDKIRTPKAGNHVMGIVLGASRNEDTDAQSADILLCIDSEAPITDEYAREFLPNTSYDSLSNALKKLIQFKGRLLPMCPCADNVPDLTCGDFISVYIDSYIPDSKSVFSILGCVIAITSSPPSLHIEKGWKTR